ncbi:hypothetical protein BHE90_016108 [Fusarium euwallaceae]|uniref:Xylanolytic transcriptional activator regulatory domain-containing protein n=1 Tax=Fusarium euwallaceae TaxID=1147111 RepID=A0A430L1E9_9HYPO|nr:hypothetical protein BHE90_016108 [Fusarium euwallaceae]
MLSRPLQDWTLPPQELINHLLDVYFDCIHPQLRLLHRPNFLVWVRSGAFLSDRDDTLLLLSAMFALATRYSDQPEVDLFDRSLFNKSENNDRLGVSGDYTSRKRWQRGGGFLCRAKDLFHRGLDEMEKLELETGSLPKPSIRFLQASALLSYAEVGTAASTRAYSSISTSVRLAYDCGLDQVDGGNAVGAEQVGIDASRDNPKNEVEKKEELRRAWWAIADMENFICTVKCRPRMIDWAKCRTRLPSDDRDWFEGRETSTYFLPTGLSELHACPTLPSYISVMARRILAVHLMAEFVPLVVSRDSLTETHDPLSTIEECAVSWKLNDLSDHGAPYSLPPQSTENDEVLSDALPLRILIEWQVSAPLSLLSLFFTPVLGLS